MNKLAIQVEAKRSGQSEMWDISVYRRENSYQVMKGERV